MLELSITQKYHQQFQVQGIPDGLVLHHLDIWMRVDTDHLLRVPTLMTNILQDVTKQRELTSFSFETSYTPLNDEVLIGVENLIAQVISSLPRLRTLWLRCSGLRLCPIWLVASGSASLKTFKFEDVDIHSTILAPRPFYSLQTVEIESMTVDTFRYLLESLNPAELKTLGLSIERSSRGDIDAAIASCARFSSLKSLSLKLGGATSTWVGLSSLLSCTLVENIELEAMGLDTMLTDAVICTIAKA